MCLSSFAYPHVQSTQPQMVVTNCENIGVVKPIQFNHKEQVYNINTLPSHILLTFFVNFSNLTAFHGLMGWQVSTCFTQSQSQQMPYIRFVLITYCIMTSC